MTRRTALLIASSFAAAAQQAPPPSATVQVTATRFAEEPMQVPASVTVLSGQELLDRGATDLRSALSLCAGIAIAPGGDGGPAGSVPEIWGLREFDAFLLVVDGVPWGGAFNPALTTLDLENIERIEIQRGAAPVMYGATSFVGVIHVIHRLPSETASSARLWGGTHGSGGASAILRLPPWAGVDSTLTVDGGKQGFADPRTEARRGTLAWRARAALAGGTFRADLSGAWINQDPASPVVRTGAVLAKDIPLDANHNPAGAYLNDRKVALTLGYERDLGAAAWSTTLSVSRATQNAFRGFLVDDTTVSPNAHGFRTITQITDLYFDTHLAWPGKGAWKAVLGLDHLHAQGHGQGGDFDYDVALDGGHVPASNTLPNAAAARIDDRRDFSGLYAFAEFEPFSSFLVEGGLRLNRTEEARRTAALEFGPPPVFDGGEDKRTFNRLTGSLGFTWFFWQRDQNRLAFFGDVRTAFKPAATDFGLDSQAEILEPETAKSYELGLKGQLMNGRINGEVAMFRMDFDNLVVSNSVSGSPVLQNAGKERFQGVEASLTLRIMPGLTARAAYSHHDSRFTDAIQDFGGVPTQLRGKRLEMAPYHLGGFGLTYALRTGFVGTLEGNYSGWSYMNKRNTAPTGGYTTLAASAGWRFKSAEVRISGTNLTDKRLPVAESELGDAQYYLLPSRQVNASVRFSF